MFAPFELERYFAEHEFSARRLLCTSDCESMPVKALLALEPDAEERLLSTWLGYTESRGSPSLRGDIASLYPSLGADDILVHSGAEEAILNFFLAMARPDRPVIVAMPCYQSLAEVPRALGARVVPWRLRPEGGRWILDPDELAGLLSANAGRGSGAKDPPIVAINVPHNPTGALPSRGEFERILSICRIYGAVLLSDEVYRCLETDPGDRLPAACEVYENAVSLSVLSKAWGLAGLRIGWLASGRGDILDSVATMKDYNSICASAPSETLAGIALRHADELAARNRAICSGNLERFSRFFDKWSDFFEWIPPRGSSVAFPRLKKSAATKRWSAEDGGGPDAGILASELLAERGVLLLPGSAYAYDPAHFRIGLGRRQAAEAIAIFDDWLGARGF